MLRANEKKLEREMKPITTILAVILAIVIVPLMWFVLAVRAICCGRGRHGASSPRGSIETQNEYHAKEEG
jgi:hypothetical protein